MVSFDEVVFEVLLNFGYFAGYDVAVWIFAAVQIVVVLMILLSRPKFSQRQNPCRYLHLLLLLQLLYHQLSHVLLPFVQVEYR